MKTVWLVAESRFEWFEVKHICLTKETALKRWTELRDELIEGFKNMVEYCARENYDSSDWQHDIHMLQNLKPGERCDCDYPYIEEWKVE